MNGAIFSALKPMKDDSQSVAVSVGMNGAIFSALKHESSTYFTISHSAVGMNGAIFSALKQTKIYPVELSAAGRNEWRDL